jgi:hypothetical protein
LRLLPLVVDVVEVEDFEVGLDALPVSIMLGLKPPLPQW